MDAAVVYLFHERLLDVLRNVRVDARSAVHHVHVVGEMLLGSFFVIGMGYCFGGRGGSGISGWGNFEATAGGKHGGHVGINSLLSFWGFGAWSFVPRGRTEGLPLLLHGLERVRQPLREHLVSGSGISRPSNP
jgi:hypothetical protein